MDSSQPYILVLARVLVAIVFLLNGFGIVSQARAAKELIEGGAPAGLVPYLMLSARTLQIVAGLGLAFGIYPRIAAVALLAFLVPATFVGHAFWKAAGTDSFAPQLINFGKNTCMAGGLLFIAATPSQPALLSEHFVVDAAATTLVRGLNESPTPDEKRRGRVGP
jgi:putative oxidoreductase